MRRPSARVATSLLLAVLAARPLAAQCPDGTPPPCRAAAVPAPVPARGAVPPLSIAVLPFESRSPDTADAYFADGITEEVANRLTRVSRLQVKARGLVAAQVRRTPDPFEAARRLGVAWFVHGNVRHASGQLMVNVELVRATSGEEAWASRFPRRDADVFAVQAEVAESVAAVVGGRLSPGEVAVITRRPTRDNEAYRLYLYGNSLLGRRTERDLEQAIGAYAGAVERDPSFAAAWARLGMARGIEASWGWTSLTFDSLLVLGHGAAQRAMLLDSSAADVRLATAYMETVSGDLGAAREQYERAIRLDSLNAETFHLYGMLYTNDCPRQGGCLDNLRAAAPLLHRALALDPTLRNTWRHLARVERDAGRLAEAEAHLDTALSFGDWGPASRDRAYVRALRGNRAGAIQDLDATGAAGLRTDTLRALWGPLIGDTASARAMLAGLRGVPDPNVNDLSLTALIEAALGLGDDALATLERLRQKPYSHEASCGPGLSCSASLVTWLTLNEPVFAPFRSSPRFQALWNDVRPRVPWLERAP